MGPLHVVTLSQDGSGVSHMTSSSLSPVKMTTAHMSCKVMADSCFPERFQFGVTSFKLHFVTDFLIIPDFLVLFYKKVEQYKMTFFIITSDSAQR